MRLKRLTELTPGLLVWYQSDISHGPMLLLESSPETENGHYPYIRLLRTDGRVVTHYARLPSSFLTIAEEGVGDGDNGQQ